MGLQAVEQSETIHRVEDTCICSSLHIQGRFTYMESHRCPLHNDAMEHDCTVKNIVPGLIYADTRRCTLYNDTMENDCTVKNIVPGLIVPSGGQLDTPRTVEDRCICSSLHIHGSSVNVCYYHRCPIHNNTASWRWCPVHNDSEVTVPSETLLWADNLCVTFRWFLFFAYCEMHIHTCTMCRFVQVLVHFCTFW